MTRSRFTFPPMEATLKKHRANRWSLHSANMPPLPDRSRSGLARGGTFIDMSTEMVEIPGFPGYAVDREGNVYSLERKVLSSSGRLRTFPFQKRKLGMSWGGYPTVNLRAQGKYIMRSVHRLMALTFLGVEPEQFVDHINGNRADNRLGNLRIATKSQNGFNSRGWSKRLKGAFPAGKRWFARIRCDGKIQYLGCFATEQEAHAAYCKAAKKLHGDFYYEPK